MATASNNLPQEVGPPEGVVTQQIRPENGYISRKNNDLTYSLENVKSAFWDLPRHKILSNLKKQFNQLTIDNNNTMEERCREIRPTLFDGKYENISESVNNNDFRFVVGGKSSDPLHFSPQLTSPNVVKDEDPLVNVKKNVSALYNSSAELIRGIAQKNTINVETVGDTDKDSKNAFLGKTCQEQEHKQNDRPLKNRNSFHQDVNEALNSLLWQPYEYQNKQISDDSSSSSSFSSYCSLSSLDLERGPNNGTSRCGNTADLHLTVEMVNNLASYEYQLGQSQEPNRSRDLPTENKPSRLLSNVSPSEQREVIVSCPSFDGCDECGASFGGGGNMRVEISSHPVTPTLNNVVATTAEPENRTPGGEGGGAAVQQHRHSYISPPPASSAKHGYQRSVSSDMIPSNLNSIVSANVVGLPNHPRHGSVPSNRNSNFIFPNHPRNSSEPVVVNHTRNGSTPTQSVTVSSTNISCANIVSILSHHRHSSHVSGIDVPVLPPNSLRSASVPKAQNIGESSTTTLNISNPSRHTNISAVDVNFYRAVPVTVVSNVPMIQCDLGNNVSNVNIVQAMPPTTTTVNMLSTQVTVHSSQNEEFKPSSATSPPVVPPPASSAPEVRTRTFTSTEAQTDDISVGSALVRNTERALNREQRRRERRERRHLRRVNNTGHQHGGGVLQGTARSAPRNERLPDLLNSHMPPPYTPNHSNLGNVSSSGPTVVTSALVHNSLVPGTIVPNNLVPGSVVGSHVVSFPPPVVSGQVPLVQAGAPVAVPVPTPSGFRFPFATAGFRR